MNEIENVVIKETTAHLSEEDFKISGNELEYKTFFLDEYQVAQVNDMGKGHRVILANPGAGKSVLLLSKAFKYASMFKESKVLLTCYNSNLADSYRFKKACADFGDNKNLFIMTFHKLVNEIYRQCLHKRCSSPYATDEEIQSCIDMVKGGKLDLRFKAIFIDEVQIFNPLYLELCYYLLDREDPDHVFLMAGDLNQAVRKLSRRGDAPWKQINGVNLDFTGRVRYIEKNYRNSKEIPSDENKTYATYEDGTVIVPETVNLDIRKINELLESKEYSGAYVSTGNFIDYTSKGMYNSRIDNTIIWSAYANELSNNDDFLLKGRDISLSDNKECSATVVISDVTERNLFGDEEDSIGKTILIQVENSVIPAIVVGVYMDLSYSIYNAGILYLNHSYIETKYSNLLNNQYWQRQEFTITMEDIDNKELFKQKAVTDINNILNDSQWQLNAITDTESLESTRNLVSIILDIVFVIACISLFIGSIGIMSIMIITVTERTSEIGIRKALGASNTLIMFQFLFESLTLSSLGTGLGILLGMIMSKIVAIKASSYLSEEFHMPIAVNLVLPVEMLISAVLCAIFIGILFGLYPAFRASKLEIVDSIRFE